MAGRAQAKLDPIVGREAESARIAAFLAGGARPGTLLIEGVPGVGKTTLWDAGVGIARREKVRLLAVRPSGAEAQLSFAALTDLLDGVDVASVPGVPEPQREALDVALLRSRPGDAKPGSRAVALGLLNVLRALTSRPLVVAIDDVQWLDRPSAEALAFCARRLDEHDVRFLVTKRRETRSELEAALPNVERMSLDPLSMGAVRRLLHERLDLVLTRRVLR
ncbi:MAG TPA: ATP-binding protein, partial [Gaiellaceae bacterium]|nr:ATP-binding protein [Gaiellaceae bacterium]